MKWLLVLALLTPLGVGNAQVYFNVQQDVNHNWEYFQSVVRLDGSNSLLTAGGEARFSAPYLNNFLISNFDETGQLLWYKSISIAPNQYGNSINLIKINEAFSLVEGTLFVLKSDTTYDSQQCFIKISNTTGDTIWVKKYGLPNWENSSGNMIKTGDDGFAVVGWTFTGTGRSKVSLIKLDSSGNQVFYRTYTTDNSKNHFGWSLLQTADGGFLLACFNKYNGPCNGCIFNDVIREAILIKTDASGNQQWSKIFPVSDFREIGTPVGDIAALPNGNFLLTGFKDYYPVNEPDFTYVSRYYFWTINPDGELIDSVSYGKHFNAIVNRLLPVNDGSYLAVGWEVDTPNINGQTGLLLKVTPRGDPIWKREYRVSPPESKIHDAFFNAIEMPDHGFVLCGRAYGPLEDSTNQNAWIIRVDSLGCLEPGCDTLFTAVHDPPTELGLLLSPNPTADEVRLVLTDPDAVLLGVRLLDIQGRIIEDVQYLRSAGWRSAVLDLGAQPTGMYVVQVRTSKGWVVRKVIRQ